jgi:hypothetical protein
MIYKSYTANLQSVKIRSYIFLLLHGNPIASFTSQEACDNFVAEFMR